jgi:hypothetical protein
VELVEELQTTSRQSPVPTTRLQFCGIDLSPEITASYRNGQDAEEYSIVESLGGGIGMVDVDADGWIDLTVPLGGGFQQAAPVGRGVAVLRNRHGEFSDVSSVTGVAEPRHYNHGIAATDVDHDGFTDILVSGFGGVSLFINAGDGTFRDSTADSGLHDPAWSSSAAWGDFDQDGNNDIFIAHYVNWGIDHHPECFARDGTTRDVCSPRIFAGLKDAIWLSNGDGSFRPGEGTFALADAGKGLATLAADVDQDGDVDVYVANDTVPNRLYRNLNGDGFDDVSALSGASVSDQGIPDGSMSIDAGDYNNDGRPDLWVSNYERESFALYRNQGNAFFRHVSDVTGIQATGGSFVGWGSAFCDFDADGDEDVMVANGHVIYHSEHAPLLQPMLLFENHDGEYFHDVAAASEVLTLPRSCRGLALGDLNHDLLVDAVVSVVNERPLLLQNNCDAMGRSFSLRLVGTRSPRHPIGASVTMQGEKWSTLRMQKGGGSYASTFDPSLYFSSPGEQDVELQVTWPGKVSRTSVAILPGRRWVLVERGNGQSLYAVPD